MTLERGTMTDNEFLLQDRIQKIRQVIGEYGENNFYISFSGGKDSVALSALVDEAITGNKIPRVYFNTGIEFQMMVEFVRGLSENDGRIEIIEPRTPIRQMLEEEGYPFKSKYHSKKLSTYQANEGFTKGTYYYANSLNKYSGRFGCPKILSFQFNEGYTLKVSPKCCDRLKKDIANEYSKSRDIEWAITGIMFAEGGTRQRSSCIMTSHKKFNPLFPLPTDWIDWYIGERELKICDLYYPPYNFERTGCKGCPYNIHLQKELDKLSQYLPAEAKQCEIIWKPVYDEYRRLGYRLRPNEIEGQMTICDFI